VLYLTDFFDRLNVFMNFFRWFIGRRFLSQAEIASLTVITLIIMTLHLVKQYLPNPFMFLLLEKKLDFPSL